MLIPIKLLTDSGQLQPMIEVGIVPGRYTIGVEVKGKHHQNARGPQRLILDASKGENVDVKYYITRER
jgi:hypothetical protein